jgi:hypothetical protein
MLMICNGHNTTYDMKRPDGIKVKKFHAAKAFARRTAV